MRPATQRSPDPNPSLRKYPVRDTMRMDWQYAPCWDLGGLPHRLFSDQKDCAHTGIWDGDQSSAWTLTSAECFGGGSPDVRSTYFAFGGRKRTRRGKKRLSLQRRPCACGARVSVSEVLVGV